MNGSCVPVNCSFKCECQTGYDGWFCERKVPTVAEEFQVLSASTVVTKGLSFEQTKRTISSINTLEDITSSRNINVISSSSTTSSSSSSSSVPPLTQSSTTISLSTPLPVSDHTHFANTTPA
jgi:hypothetical protein